jgi:hypothetical protein
MEEIIAVLRLRLCYVAVLAVSRLEKNPGEAENLPVLRLKVSARRVLAVNTLRRWCKIRRKKEIYR